MLPCPMGPPLHLALLAILAVAAAATDPPELCEPEMNKIKDLLQVSCVEKGLTGIPPGLPKDTGILLLSSNHLAQVSTASLQHLTQLRELDLSNNSLAALETKGAPLPGLQQLLLSHNALQRLPALRGLPNVTRLALGHNAISQLPQGGFRDLGNLQDLELQGNRLQHLPPGAFEGLARLKDLDLSENGLESLPGALLAGLNALEILRLERNRLENVPDGFFPEENLFAYVYLVGNPWVCDCRLVYLRDWILENEFSVYTRTPVWERGLLKETTENEAESVTCAAPAREKGKPVLRFKAACGDVDGEEEEEAAVTTLKPPSATLQASSSPPAVLTARAPSTPAAATPTAATTTTTAVTESPSAAAAPTTTTALSPTPPTTSMIPSTLAATLTASQTTAPTKTLASLPPSRQATESPSVMAQPTTAPQTTHLAGTTPSNPTPPASTTPLSPPAETPPPGPPAPVPTCSPPKLPTPCSCPVLPPARALEGHPPPPFPATWAGWLAGHCCALRLALYLACLGLVVLPTLAVLCCLGWSYPALRSPAGPRLARYQRLTEAAPRGWQLRGSPASRPQTYRVCKTFRVAPSRHVTWLLVSLPGPAKPWPRGGRQGQLSAHSLDRGSDAIGAVRVKYATSSL